MMDLKLLVKVIVLPREAASPGSINGRHEGGGVGTTEDVGIDPHRPVDAAALVLLLKDIQ